MITTDAFVIGSGFINAAAIKHGIYMQPQTKEQVIAHCLSDLASGYISKYGYDKFVIQCVDSVLAYAPANLQHWLLNQITTVSVWYMLPIRLAGPL